MTKLQTRVIYGLRTDIEGNAHYITDDEVLYVVGNAMAIHNFTQHRQRLIRLPDRNRVNFMTISPNKKFAALCETGEKPLISIWDLQSLKRKRLLGIPYDTTGAISSFKCLDFSFDSKYIAAVTSENQAMLFYNWEKGKLESNLDLVNTHNPESRVTCISCNPSDIALVAVGGPYCFKMLTLSETLWRPFGFTKADNIIVTSVTWLNSDRILAGTSDGRILFLENGELKQVFKASETMFMNMKIRDENAIQLSTSANPNESDVSHAIMCLLTFSRGFVFAYGYGMIVVFEKDGNHKYLKRNVYVIPRQISNEESSHLYKINRISSNISSDKLIITTGWSQLFCATLWGPDLQTDPEPQLVQTISFHLHHGAIGGLSTCTWKSHIMTFGKIDRSVRMWDYETESLIMVKQYSEDIFCVVLHPSGLFCLIGFSDKLRFESVLLDNFETIKEFSIRGCKIAAFSFGGHLFAAVNGNIIQVFSTIDFENRFVLKGHSGTINAIVWAQDDSKLYSIGSEGAVYEWSMTSGERIEELVLKDSALTGIVLSVDGATAYCVSKHGRVHEIKEGAEKHIYNLLNVQPESVVMGKDDTLMFVTYPGGHVASLKCPLQEPIDFFEYRIHNTDITQIALTYDEHALVTGGADGSLCFWKVVYTDGKTPGPRDLLYLEQILIGRDDLADKVQSIKDLNSRVRELESEHAYKTRHTMLQHNDQLREIHEGYCEAIEQLHDKIGKLEEDHANEINSINIEISKTKKKHEEAVRNMEISYDLKLIVEYDKYAALERRTNEMREDFERQLRELAQQDKAHLEDTMQAFQDRLDEKERQLMKAHEEVSQQTNVHEVVKAQIEDDADREIIEVRTTYESLLYSERQKILQLKGEAGVLRNKHANSIKELEESKLQLQTMRNDFVQLKERKEELDREVIDLRSDLTARDSTILGKDERIGELELANDELEKIRFVLNHRVQELQAQIDPRDAEIAELKTKIADMETELLGMDRASQRQQLRLIELREQLASSKREIQHQGRINKKCRERLKRMRVDLLNAAALIHEPTALKNMIIKLYQRYSDQAQFLRDHQADVDVQCEFAKQRDHLENAIALLKKQLNATSGGTSESTQLTRVFEDNVELLGEMSGLRDELKAAQKHIADMEGILGLKGKNISSAEARAKLAKAVHGNEELERAYNEQMQECRAVVEGLRENLELLLLERDYDKKEGQQ